MSLTKMAAVSVIAFLTVTCSGDDLRPASTSKTERGVAITKTEYGADWPYTIDSGYLYCDAPGSNVVMAAAGRVYALNGRAMGNAAKRGYLNARETITLRDENGFFTVGDTQKIIQRGFSLCQ